MPKSTPCPLGDASILPRALTNHAQWTPAGTNSPHRAASRRRARTQADAVDDLQKWHEGNLFRLDFIYSLLNEARTT